MNIEIIRKVAASVTVLTLACTATCYASETGEAHHALPPFSEFLGHIALYWYNFLVYVAILAVILRRPLQGVWAKRRQSILNQLDKAERSLDAARKRLFSAEDKVNRLGEHLAQLRRTYLSETEAESRHMLDEGHRQMERIRKQAHDAAIAERKQAESRIKAEVLESALELAGGELKREVTPEKDRKFRESGLGHVRELMH